LLALGGIVMGVALGSLLAAYVQHYGFFIGDFGISGVLIGERIYTYLQLKDVVTLAILAFIITLLAALYPALVAAHMEPVEALHGKQ
jgi:ABC-type lipoprotein release transport system permease subunit